MLLPMLFVSFVLKGPSSKQPLLHVMRVSLASTKHKMLLHRQHVSFVEKDNTPLMQPLFVKIVNRGNSKSLFKRLHTLASFVWQVKLLIQMKLRVRIVWAGSIKRKMVVITSNAKRVLKRFMLLPQQQFAKVVNQENFKR